MITLNKYPRSFFNEDIRAVLGMDAETWARTIVDYCFDVDEYRKENETMAAGAFNNETEERVFRVGDRVKHTRDREVRGPISLLQAVLNTPDGPTIVSIDHLTHYDGPTSEDDAWERVTMDIASEVRERTGINGNQSVLYDTQKRAMRHDAYVVLGSVLKVDEEVKARVRGIIERAETRYQSRY